MLRALHAEAHQPGDGPPTYATLVVVHGLVATLLVWVCLPSGIALLRRASASSPEQPSNSSKPRPNYAAHKRVMPLVAAAFLVNACVGWTQRGASAEGMGTHGKLGWALTAIVVDHLTVTRAAAGLGVSWHTANSAILAEGRRRLIDAPGRFDGVTTLGVDEHVWRHTRYGDKYVTVIIDLTPAREKTGPAQLLDMVEGRSKAVFKQWLAARPKEWSKRIEVVAMDGFSGFKTAAAEELPDAVPVMDPFHVVRLAGDALDVCRRRVQQDLHGHRGMKGDPLYQARRTLHTGDKLLTDRQRARLEALFATEEHVEVEATWGIYQRMIAAYREPDKKNGKQMMQTLIDAVSTGVPAALVEIRKLGRTLKQRAADVLAFFDRPGTSNGPTEAINGRLEHLRGSALGFRNLTNYIARSLLEAGGFRPQLHP